MYIKYLILSLAFLLSSCSKQKQEYVDSIYINGSIITIDDKKPTAEAVSAKDGLIYSVGSNKDIEKLRGPKTKVFDLIGKTLVPGFVDAHSHFSGVGTQAIVANLLPSPDGPVNTIADLQNELRVFLKNSQIVKDYKVVIGFNYDDSQ
ncbi:MAG: putative amidohydrolase YtcJ, partial [Crocinitomicaceae bacterium]